MNQRCHDKLRSSAMQFEVPEALRKNRLANGNIPAVQAWLDAIPSLVSAAAERWSLTVLPPFDGLSYNYVAPAIRAGGTHAVLKVAFPGADFDHELAATRAFDGHGCARLLEAGDDSGTMLLERLEPGAMLHTLEDDEAEVSIAAAIMRGLWRPPPEDHVFPLARDWLAQAGAPTVLPARKLQFPWMSRALERAAELAAETEPEYLLHGDLHHMNILSAQREPWLAIDPHGVVGDAAWEIAPFLFNHLRRFPKADHLRIVRRRADQFAEELGLSRERVYAWSAVRCIQSAFWSLVDERIDDEWGALATGETLSDAT
jgi:streptomycin 6-kinase